MRIMNSGTRRFAAIFLMVAFLVTQFPMLEAYAAVVDPDITEETIITEEIVEEEAPVVTNDLDEPEELLNDYMEVLTAELAEEYDAVSYEAKSGIIPSRLRGSKLTGAEKTAYDFLKAKIVEVAAGDNEEGLTKFEIDYGSIYSEVVLNKKYSAAELGIDVAVEYNPSTGRGEITEAAKKAIGTKYDLRASQVINALLYDCPYELFWFDKTAGVDTERLGKISAVLEDNEWKVYCTPASTFTFYLAVSEDYTPDSYYVHDFVEGEASIQTDTTKIKALNKSVENAMKVVSNAADNESTDAGKLSYYKNWICKEVSYNYAAANVANNTPYGDPWQLIYAFDGDENTNQIVCEGYSKAFKYLCDLTTFNGDIDCRIVTGIMAGGIGAGKHMWNVVEIGGSNYLVDVTNCDAGTIGASDKLFLVGNNNAASIAGHKYVFANVGNISYEYDVDTEAIFEAAELSLATSNYSSNTGGTAGENEGGGTEGNEGGGTGGNEGGTTGGTESGEEPENPAPKDIANAEISGLADVTYTGKEIIQKPIVTMGDNVSLEEGKDYTLSYRDNVNAGTATVVVNAIEGSGYTGTKEVIFKINPVIISGLKTSGIPARTYNGKAHTQNLKLSIDGKELKNGTDYTITYKNNINAGTATFTVTYKGNYIGTSTGSFKINKAANPLAVKAKTATLKAKDVKKKARTLAISKLVTFTKKGQGKLTYTKASGSKGITIDKKTGTVKVKKGVKKGTYKVKINVTAAGNGNYNKATKTITVTIKIK